MRRVYLRTVRYPVYLLFHQIVSLARLSPKIRYVSGNRGLEAYLILLQFLRRTR